MQTTIKNLAVGTFFTFCPPQNATRMSLVVSVVPDCPAKRPGFVAYDPYGLAACRRWAPEDSPVIVRSLHDSDSPTAPS